MTNVTKSKSGTGGGGISGGNPASPPSSPADPSSGNPSPVRDDGGGAIGRNSGPGEGNSTRPSSTANSGGNPAPSSSPSSGTAQNPPVSGPTFGVVDNNFPKKSHHKKTFADAPTVSPIDADMAKVLANAGMGSLNALVAGLVGPWSVMTETEMVNQRDILARMISRLEPAQAKIAQVYLDPILFFLGLGAWGVRVSTLHNAVKAQQDEQNRARAQAANMAAAQQAGGSTPPTAPGQGATRIDPLITETLSGGRI